MSNWTAARIKQLRHDWANGDSASMIAAEFGITRNAVLGKVHRLKLASHAGYQRPAKPKLKPTPRDERWRGTPFRPTAKPVCELLPSPPPIEDHNIPLAQRRALLNLESHHCRWPIGGPTEKAVFFCGGLADINEGRPYCQQHAARARVVTRQLYVAEKVMV